MYIIRKPIFPLNQFVKYFWIYESSLDAKNEIQTFIVQGCPIIIFHYKKPLVCKTGDRNWATHPQQCIIGQIKCYGEITETGDEGLIAVVFQPDGLFPFTKVPVDAVTELIVDLQEIMGKDINDIQDKICNSKSSDDRICIIENYFLQQLKSSSNNYRKEIRYALSRMQQNNKISVANLAFEVNMSKRNFERRFLEHVGLPPVFYNRIVRFQKAIELINKPDKRSFTDLAYSAGYYDQSHFIRDFKQFYGMIPKEFNNDQNFS